VDDERQDLRVGRTAIKKTGPCFLQLLGNLFNIAKCFSFQLLTVSGDNLWVVLVGFQSIHVD
jgi:hypothetical protein